MIEAARNAFRLPDLRKKILFTLFILVIYRLAAHIPVPGVNRDALAALFQSSAGTLINFLDLFSGGGLSNFSVVTMGVYPYITASIIMQLLVGVVPSLERLAKEGGDAGRARINQYTHLLTLPLAALQGYGQAYVMKTQGILTSFDIINAPIPTLSIVISMTAGTIFAMWLGELISEQGIGSGISIIIFGGIVAQIPLRVGNMIATGNYQGLLIFVVITVVTIIGIVYVNEGARRVPVSYGKRVRGMKMYGGQSTHIPLKVNSSGMIPLIFALSILILPGAVAQYFASTDIEHPNFANAIVNAFSQTNPVYWITYFFMVIAFTYFYTDLMFRQQNLPESLQQQGGFIPGIRPGKKTEEYLTGVLHRITFVGAVFLGVVAILPFAVRDFTETTTLIITSTGLLIVVGVVLDTMKQLEAQLLMRHYEGFIK